MCVDTDEGDKELVPLFQRLRNLAVRRLQHGRNHMLDRDELISHLISRRSGLGKEFSDFGIHRRRDPLSREGDPSVKPVLQFLLQYLILNFERSLHR